MSDIDPSLEDLEVLADCLMPEPVDEIAIEYGMEYAEEECVTCCRRRPGGGCPACSDDETDERSQT